MPGYTIINLREIEDSVGERAPGIEGRFGRASLESRDLGVSLWNYAPGVRTPFAHTHGEQEEAYIVIAGSGRALLDGEVRDLQPWDVLRVSPEVSRALEAGPEGLELLIIGGPRPEGGDGHPGGETPWPED